MSEGQDRSISEVSKLLFVCLYDLQRTVTQDWQSLSMTMAQLKVLLTVSFKGPMAISKLAEELSISHPTASQLVDHLVQVGFVKRVESSTDRRFTLAHLTQSGEQLAQRLWQGRMDHLHACLAQLDEQDLAMVLQGLRALTQVTASLASEPPAGQNPLEGYALD